MRAWFHDYAGRSKPYASFEKVLDQIERELRALKQPAAIPPPPAKIPWKSTTVPSAAKLAKLPAQAVFGYSVPRLRGVMFVKLGPDRWLESRGANLDRALQEWRNFSERPPTGTYSYGTDFSVRFELLENKKRAIKTA